MKSWEGLCSSCCASVIPPAAECRIMVRTTVALFYLSVPATSWTIDLHSRQPITLRIENCVFQKGNGTNNSSGCLERRHLRCVVANIFDRQLKFKRTSETLDT